MQLDRIEAVVRPRNPWESIDLGFSMVRRWWKPLYKIWFAFMLPLFLILYIFFHNSLWIAVLIVWWLKPFLDRIILHFLSHALFGEQPSFRQTFKALPHLFKTRLLLALTFWRFDFSRSFNLPVWQLEGLRGKAASKRMNLLLRSTRRTAVWLTIVCLHFEWVLSLSLFGLLQMMAPTTYNIDLFEIFFHGEALWIESIHLFFTLLVISIIEPLYVAGGFALYLNRRSHLEGWDIELAFRRIATRLSIKK
ncbi:hypothetical protein [Candidatus Parabeggiatoa sp. HSG14]|uniref:hypothetical protein n=1 Tax=Candidatus Parabeggiatoa sp. HSG14 TaxID=3055593 RepID=UPI0025A74212|nr:hypothetical protein [Thiotrichales bacterium HSG14]